MIRREYNDTFRNVPITSMLAGTKSELDNEITLIGRFKEKIENEIGEPIGKIIDPDGRQI